MNIHYPLLLDGGLSNELERQGCNLDHKLWSARMLDEHPEAIIEAHLSYLKAGAQCLITSSYQASMPGLLEAGFEEKRVKSLILSTVELASEAVRRFKIIQPDSHRPLIAASIGPYGAYLADGSEYRGDYGLSDEELRSFHIDRINILDQSDADCFAVETIPSFQEAKVLAEILTDTQKQAWISFSCKDELHINDGTPIATCVKCFNDHPNVFAIGVNCTAPQHISGLIKTIKEHSHDKKIVVYPNSGEVYNAQSKTWMGISDPNAFTETAKEWLELGVDILGGCCRIGPDHIRCLSREI